MKSKGISFVSRYVCYGDSAKVITKSEYNSYISAGLNVFLNWEFDAHDGNGGASSGTVHAIEAVRQCKSVGYPKGSTIYFSVGDFDVIGEGSTAACDSYCLAARKVVHDAGYRFGVYSGYHYMSHLWFKGLIDDGWQSPSSFGHPGWIWDDRNSIHQTQLGYPFGGYDVDLNVKVGVTHGALDSSSNPVPPEGDDDLTKDESAALNTTAAISYAQAMGADTFWQYSPNGTRKSVSMKAYWDKVAAVVAAKGCKSP